ncbi:isocitrate lyase/phosphoenolpyruvate mutase family protein [Streptomyces sp. ME03-5709C]|nr:isocitrate lyase/phosphoenolpyruvate mutase family protein [Streptomyces sp. ME03-5709C]
MSTESSRTTLAHRLRVLHVPGDPLVLPNVWDCASAHAVADAGFPVVATGSAAVALVLGYEDGEGTPADEMLAGHDEQADYIARLRAADPDLVINARTDCLLRGGARPGERLPETAYRAQAYLEAGADCVYPIGALDEPTVEAVVEAVGGRPVNVLSLPGGPTPARLAELGVARISFGDQLHRLVHGYLSGLVTAVARGDSPATAG